MELQGHSSKQPKRISYLFFVPNLLDERLSGQINLLDEKVSGLGKRLENQEFTNRGILIGLIVVVLGGAAKFFGFLPKP